MCFLDKFAIHKMNLWSSLLRQILKLKHQRYSFSLVRLIHEKLVSFNEKNTLSSFPRYRSLNWSQGHSSVTQVLVQEFSGKRNQQSNNWNIWLLFFELANCKSIIHLFKVTLYCFELDPRVGVCCLKSRYCSFSFGNVYLCDSHTCLFWNATSWILFHERGEANDLSFIFIRNILFKLAIRMRKNRHVFKEWKSVKMHERRGSQSYYLNKA